MENIDGLIYAYLLDKKGGAKKISLQEYENRKADDIIWLHFDYTNENSVNWLENNSGLDEIVTTALLTPETRPRTVFLDDSILIALRGINFNVNAQPEDMVSLRVFINENQIITTKKRDMLSVAEIAQELELKKGVKNSSEFLITLVDKITSKMQETIDELEESSLDLEENVLSDESASIKTKISSFRKELLSLKRYLYPQKDALNKLVFNSISWLTDYDKIKLKEVTDHLIRYIEEIETLKDKLSLIQEEFTNKISEQMNQRVLYLINCFSNFLTTWFFHRFIWNKHRWNARSRE